MDTKSVAINFDGVVCPFSKGLALTPPYQTTVDFIRQLKDKKIYIIFYSNRFVHGYSGDAAGQIIGVEKYLLDYGVPFDELHTGTIFPITDFLIDTKAFKYSIKEQDKILRDIVKEK